LHPAVNGTRIGGADVVKVLGPTIAGSFSY
jgi:hypothetical protein